MDNLIIRKAKIDDAQSMLDFVLQVSDETDFLTSNAKDRNLTLQKEVDFLSTFGINNKSTVFVAVINDNIVASINLTAKSQKRLEHRASIGVSVLKKYWSKGIGSILFEKIIDYAKSVDIKKLELEVRTDNTKAIALYKKFGFEIEGEIKSAMLIDDMYFNEYIMGLFI